jgi:hypothetical protein
MSRIRPLLPSTAGGSTHPSVQLPGVRAARSGRLQPRPSSEEEERQLPKRALDATERRQP